MRLRSPAPYDPVVEALFGVLGVIVGAVLAGSFQYLLLRRRERADLKVAQRLVTLELSDIRDLLDAAGEAGFESSTYSVEAFAAYRAILARELDDQAWEMVADAYGLLASHKEVVALDSIADPLALTESREQQMRTLDGSIASALDALYGWTP
jgi:hypothetical protein